MQELLAAGIIFRPGDRCSAALRSNSLARGQLRLKASGNEHAVFTTSGAGHIPERSKTWKQRCASARGKGGGKGLLAVDLLGAGRALAASTGSSGIRSPRSSPDLSLGQVDATRVGCPSCEVSRKSWSLCAWGGALDVVGKEARDRSSTSSGASPGTAGETRGGKANGRNHESFRAHSGSTRAGPNWAARWWSRGNCRAMRT